MFKISIQENDLNLIILIRFSCIVLIQESLSPQGGLSYDDMKKKLGDVASISQITVVRPSLTTEEHLSHTVTVV